MIVEVHDPDGDWDHGLGSWDPCRADLSHLGGDRRLLLCVRKLQDGPMDPRLHGFILLYNSLSLGVACSSNLLLIAHGKGDEIYLVIRPQRL